MTTTVEELAELVGGEVIGEGGRQIAGITDLRVGGSDRIGFVRDAQYRDAAQETTAGALIVYEPLQTPAVQILVADVGVAFAKVALHFHPTPRAEAQDVHPTAIVHPEAVFDGPVQIGPHAVVGRCRIGAGSVLMSGVSVADGCTLGSQVVLYPRVVCYEGVRIADRVIVHAGAVIGSDGFGYARDGVRFIKVPQMGGVEIAEDVEIGANVTIDRGAMGLTKIGARSKIDNLCHIAHNVVVGEDCVFAAAAFVAGSTVFGDRVILAGHAAISGHLKIASDVRIGGNSCILQDVKSPGDYMGHPLMPKTAFVRLWTTQKGLVQRLQDIEGRLRQLPDPDGVQGR